VRIASRTRSSNFGGSAMPAEAIRKPAVVNIEDFESTCSFAWARPNE
jgi:hypothetical protein